MQNNKIAGLLLFIAGCFAGAVVSYIKCGDATTNQIHQPPKVANVFDSVTFKRVNIEGVDCIVGSSKRYSTLSMVCNWGNIKKE